MVEMFDPGDTSPRIFGLPPGCDFPEELVRGLLDRSAGLAPERLARVTLYVNTRRMQRKVSRIFDTRPACLLPRIKLLSDLGQDHVFPDLTLPVSPLRRRLELARLVAQLIDTDPSLAPRAAAFDLATSLAGLVDEMQGEGVTLDALERLDTGGLSEHWDRSRRFLALAARYLSDIDAPLDPEARQRRVVELLVSRWAQSPPTDPIIVAGSTGSRGTTALFMEAVASLPQGAVVLPGFDTDLPDEVWRSLAAGEAAEDHPQFRFARLLSRLGLDRQAVHAWTETDPPAPARNGLVSLALRPAPVTDAWRRDGPGLGNLNAATEGLTLIEAPDPRSEAAAIAWLLREAAETKTPAALVTPDRMLTRRVTALLDRWNITPDDSAGRPLALSPPGRLLRQTAQLLATRATLPGLLALLKHPLTHAGSDRGEHLRRTRDLELWLRDEGAPWIDRDVIARHAGDQDGWANWLGALLDRCPGPEQRPLEDHVAAHLALAERLVAGSADGTAASLWDKPAGRAAQKITADLAREAVYGGVLDATEYAALFQSILAVRGSPGAGCSPSRHHDLGYARGTCPGRPTRDSRKPE